MKPFGLYVNCEFTWFVGSGDPYITLPHSALTGIEHSRLPNPFKFPRSLGTVVEPPPLPQSPPHIEPAPSASTLSLQSLSDQLERMRVQAEAHQQRQMVESDHMMTYLRGIYASQVEAGYIRSPYLNFPHHPPQQGPVPGWHGGQPTYPYYPPRPEGIDYRFPGGSDPRFDPNNPPFETYPEYPPDYYSMMPPMEDTWGAAPLPPGFSRAGPSSSHPSPPTGMDEDEDH